ncbi:ABC transporter ATP-binding protein [Rathayibacter soli]|uniref:ABC transporter ATP-binding protein n=1 Tax=Rathayibacter soli TaxID=3144168 RepID=UPI0027E4C1EB|nr:ABC transporter ATP-binding protein [Glaciibacter superstes]
MSAAVCLEGISKSFSRGGAPAVDNVSLHVEGGQCVAVLGPSGSGKSTLLRLVSGLEVPDSGRVTVAGQDVTHVVPEKRGMAMVSQRPLLFPHLNVIDNISFAAVVRGARRRAARADAAQFLHMVQLDDFAGRFAHELSGGQAQRVALARALAARPSVLLLDEPFSALDVELRLEMHTLLRDVRKLVKSTVLLVTHDRDDAASLADTIVLVSGGRLVQHGTVEDLYRRPVSLEASRLMGGKNEIRGTIVAGVHYSAWGAFPVPGGTPGADGKGTIVVRQESVEIITDGTGGTEATVSDVRPVGARQLVTVQIAQATLHAETTAFRAVRSGDLVHVRIPPDEIALVDRAESPLGEQSALEVQNA